MRRRSRSRKRKCKGNLRIAPRACKRKKRLLRPNTLPRGASSKRSRLDLGKRMPLLRKRTLSYRTSFKHCKRIMRNL